MRSVREYVPFYREVLDCVIIRTFDDQDDFRMGDEVFLTLVYGSCGAAVEQGTSYAPDAARTTEDFLKATFLELKSENV